MSSDPAPEIAHWRRWLAAGGEPLFLLSGKRRLAFANRRWEEVTGARFVEARGRACRRRAAESLVEPLDQVLAALAPPAEALEGRPSRARRRAPGSALVWWEIDYFPWSGSDGLLAILGKIRVVADPGPAHAALPEKLVQLRDRFVQGYRLERSLGSSAAQERLAQQIRLAASTRLPALIQGPPGSGKRWTARAIHELGPERDAFFAAFDARLPVACLAELLASSRHWRLGTLYVAGLEHLTRDAQAILSQHLATETDTPGPRLLAGSASDVGELARAGRVLPELAARVSALAIQVPAMAERLSDLPHLLDELLPRAAQAVERTVRGLSAEAVEVLRRHTWPGNVRELYDVLVQACRQAGETIAAADLPFYLRGQPPPPDKSIPLDETLEKVERRLIELALRLTNDNKSRAAELLGIWRPRLLRRIEQLGLASDDET
jgi:DNA-binding NtrC family response regulator